MKVSIVGRHPTIQPGFCGVMSLFEGKHLAELGNEVTLFIPFSNPTVARNFLTSKGFDDLNDLPKFGGDFHIEAIYLDDDPDLPDCDLLIWQSIAVEDWKALLAKSRERARVISKNYPKLVASAPASLAQQVKSQFGAFDLVTFALKEDMAALAEHRDFWAQVRHRAAFVPRGAAPDLLHPANKSDAPLIAMDTPNVVDNAGIAHFLNPLRALKEDFPELTVLSLGGVTGLPFGQNLSYRPFDQMYRDFLNPAWLYCVIDYAQSPPHIKGAIHEADRAWDSKAIYEVQTVEAQMAGTVITGMSRNIIPELVNADTSVLFGDVPDDAAIYDAMKSAIEDFPRLSRETRNWAERNFSWQRSVEDWDHAARNLVENGYDRDSNQHPVSLNGNGLRPHLPMTLRQGANDTVAALKPGEKTLLMGLADQSRCYVEFGCGGSTKIVAKSRAGRIESFETSPDWIAEVEKDPEIQTELACGRMHLHHIDIGPVKEWGYPINLNLNAAVAYSKLPWSKLNLDIVDTVLIDGRFRVVTALEAALRTHDHCRIIVDDYNDRDYYEALEELLDIEFEEERMIVFRKGEKWNRAAAFDMADKFRMDTR